MHFDHPVTGMSRFDRQKGTDPDGEKVQNILRRMQHIVELTEIQVGVAVCISIALRR